MPALIDLLITFLKVGYMYMIADDVILGLDQSEIHVTFDIFLHGVAGGDVVNQWDEKQKYKKSLLCQQHLCLTFHRLFQPVQQVYSMSKLVCVQRKQHPSRQRPPFGC
jgi:hypothetical protein